MKYRDLGGEILDEKQFTFEPIDADDDVYTFESFKGCVDGGWFIDYDGFGEWATEKEKSNAIVRPSHITGSTIGKPEWATHVVWYNR